VQCSQHSIQCHVLAIATVRKKINLLGKNTNIIKRNTKMLSHSIKEDDLQANACYRQIWTGPKMFFFYDKE
jgi:hypothetical protein